MCFMHYSRKYDSFVKPTVVLRHKKKIFKATDGQLTNIVSLYLPPKTCITLSDR